jgi:membrane protein YdbS with pleckstrin-like domain
MMLPLRGESKVMGYADKNLAPGETILYRARYHWIIYRFTIVLLILGAALGAAALYARKSQAGDEVGRPVAILAAAFVVVALIAYLVRRFRSSLDEFVVTNRRVIRKVGFYAREIQQAPLEKIQDITVEQGVLARMLGYGTVIVETASEKGMLVFPSIASPDSLRNHVWGQAPPEDRARAAIPAPSVPVSAQARLEELESLKQRGLVSQEEYASKRQEILSHL